MQFVKSKYLFLWLLIPFMIGIIGAYFCANVQWYAFSKIGVIVVFLLMMILIFTKKYGTWQQKSWFLGFFTQVFFLFFGFFAWCWHRAELRSDFFAHQSEISVFEAAVISEPQYKNEKLQCLIAFKNGFSMKNSRWKAVGGKVKLQLNCDSIDAKKLKFGAMILVPAAKVKEISAPKNPYTFDFKKYMFQQGVLHQLQVNFSSISISDKNEAPVLFRYALNLRQLCVLKFQKMFSSPVAKGIAIALILGEKTALDEETIQNFQNTGTIHILVISGMHVMYVYLFLWFFLKRLPSKWYFKVFRISLVLLSLAFYTLFTGFTPSVIRAFLMIALYVISVEINRKNNKYHVLAFAAFLMLIYEPNWLFQLGFQLSFLAVLGILFAFTALRKFLLGLHFYSYLADALSVTLSAQIFVIPYIVYLFHNAPLNFVISNLWATFPIMILMTLGTVLLFLPFSLLIKLFEWTVEILNWGLHEMSQIRFLILKDLYLSFFEMGMLSLVLFTLVLSFKYQKKAYLFAFLIAFLSFETTLEWRNLRTINQKNVLVYSFYNHYAMAFVDGKSAYVLTDINKEDKAFKNQILPYLKNHWVNQIYSDSLRVNVNYKTLQIHADTIIFNHEKWLILNKNSKPNAMNTKDFHQFLLFDFPTYKPFPEISSSQMVLLMGGKKAYYSEFYVDYFTKNKIKFLDMRKNIAYLD